MAQTAARPSPVWHEPDVPSNESARAGDGASGSEDEGDHFIMSDRKDKTKAKNKRGKSALEVPPSLPSGRGQPHMPGLKAPFQELDNAHSTTGHQADSTPKDASKPLETPPTAQEITGPELTNDLLQSLANDRKPSDIYGGCIHHNAWGRWKYSNRADSERVEEVPNALAFFTNVLSARGGPYQADGW